MRRDQRGMEEREGKRTQGKNVGEEEEERGREVRNEIEGRREGKKEGSDRGKIDEGAIKKERSEFRGGVMKD